MMTARQYEDSLRKLKLEVYMFGRRIEMVQDTSWGLNNYVGLEE
jgi:hypothetical protein